MGGWRRSRFNGENVNVEEHNVESISDALPFNTDSQIDHLGARLWRDKRARVVPAGHPQIWRRQGIRRAALCARQM